MIWKDWDRIDARTIRDRQGAMLHRFLKEQVLNYSPYYIDLFRRERLTADDVRSVADLHKIPFTSKADIAPTPEDPGKARRLVLQPDPETFRDTLSTGRKLGLMWDRVRRGRGIREMILDEYLPVFFIATTGRTAVPTPFLYTSRDMNMFREAAKRLFAISEVNRHRDMVVSVFPYAPHLAFWIVYQAGMQSGLPIFHSGGGRITGSDRIIPLIQSLRATVLVGIPGYVYHLLKLASERGADFSRIRLIVLGAERVTKGYKRRVYDLLTSMGAKDPMILSTYGFTEARVAWMECPSENSLTESTGYHLYPDMEIFETIDPDSGKPVGDGESGEIVYTALDWRGSVVLRYRTGDYARGGITWQQCPGCGRRLPRLSTDITRLSDRSELRLSKVKGTLVDFNEFFPIMSEVHGIIEWQVEIAKRNDDPHDLDEIHLRLCVKADVDNDEVESKVREMIRDRMELTVEEVSFHTFSELASRLEMEERPKEIRIRDRRKELLSAEDET